ncbi:MAG: hypothetical protein NVS1B7_7700 [Candidatus Saccharimonadales bacterium]
MGVERYKKQLYIGLHWYSLPAYGCIVTIYIGCINRGNLLKFFEPTQIIMFIKLST